MDSITVVMATGEIDRSQFQRRGQEHWFLYMVGGLLPDSLWQGWKKPGFLKKKPAQWVFRFFFCPEERVLGIFPVSRILLGASRL
jgi:hypothetical protein